MAGSNFTKKKQKIHHVHKVAMCIMSLLSNKKYTANLSYYSGKELSYFFPQSRSYKDTRTADSSVTT